MSTINHSPLLPSRNIDLPPEVIDQIFERLKPIDLMATQYVSKFFNEMTNLTIAKKTYPEKDIRLQRDKIHTLAIIDLIELGQFPLAIVKIKSFNMKNIISTLAERFQNNPTSCQLYLAIAALSDDPTKAVSYLSTPRTFSNLDIKNVFSFKKEKTSPKPDLKDFCWLKKQDQATLKKIFEIIHQTPEKSDQKTALGALSILLQLKIIPIPPLTEIVRLNPFLSRLSEFGKEILNTVYSPVLIYFVSEYATSVKNSYVFSEYSLKTKMYDAFACFNSKKIYQKADWSEYKIETYIKYASCLAKLLKLQNKNTIDLSQINPPKDIAQIQELFTKFNSILQNDEAADTFNTYFKTEISNGFLSYYLELSDENFRLEMLDLKSRMIRFISQLSHPTFIKNFSVNPDKKMLCIQLNDLFFQRVYDSLMDENHPIYGKENRLLKSEGFVSVDEILKFPHPDLQQYFVALGEFMYGQGISDLISDLKNKTYDFETFDSN